MSAAFGAGIGIQTRPGMQQVRVVMRTYAGHDSPQQTRPRGAGICVFQAAALLRVLTAAEAGTASLEAESGAEDAEEDSEDEPRAAAFLSKERIRNHQRNSSTSGVMGHKSVPNIVISPLRRPKPWLSYSVLEPWALLCRSSPTGWRAVAWSISPACPA